MNKANPLIPQGALPQSAGKGASNVRIAVLTIIAIHVVLFGGLLMQGCKRDNTKTQSGAADTSTGLTLPVMTNQNSVADNTTISAPTNTPDTNTYQTPGSLNNSQPIGNSVVSNAEPSGATSGVNNGGTAGTSGAMHEYTIARNDTLSKIAKANGTTVGAITRANNGLDPAKLKVGQKIQVPAGSPAGSATHTASGGDGAASTGSNSVHIVKAGETLTRIAKQHGVTVKALRSANALKTDRLVAGQKLKVPAHSTTNGAAGAPASSTASNATNTQ
jgi:LysM repeat protein